MTLRDLPAAPITVQQRHLNYWLHPACEADGRPIHPGFTLHVSELKVTPGIDATWIHFCPVCTRQLLTEAEIGKADSPTQAEWAEHYDGDILSMPDIHLGDEAA